MRGYSRSARTHSGGARRRGVSCANDDHRRRHAAGRGRLDAGGRASGESRPRPGACSSAPRRCQKRRSFPRPAKNSRRSVRTSTATAGPLTLAARALVALRIAGAPLVSRRASQRPTDGRPIPEGGLVREGPAGPLLISSAITPDTVLRYRASLHEEVPDRRQTLDELHQALTSLTRALYAAEGSLSADLRLDDVLTFSEGLVAAQLREHRWVARQWRSIRQRGARLGWRA